MCNAKNHTASIETLIGMTMIYDLDIQRIKWPFVFFHCSLKQKTHLGSTTDSNINQWLGYARIIGTMLIIAAGEFREAKGLALLLLKLRGSGSGAYLVVLPEKTATTRCRVSKD